MKRFIQSALLALISGSLLAACGGGGSSANDQVHTAFRTSFMTQCTKEPGYDKYCACVADAVIAKYPDDQKLADLDDKPDELKTAMADAVNGCKSQLPGAAGAAPGANGAAPASSGAAAPADSSAPAPAGT